MKKVPEKFIEKIRVAMDQECEFESCEECIFEENGMCDTFSKIVHLMECAIDENNKLEQIKK